MALRDINIVREASLGEINCKPIFGMEFDSEEAAYKFYNEYARKIGFSIRKESVVKNKRTGEVTSRIFVCSKEGHRLKDKRDNLTKNPRAETRTGCDAQMGIKLDRSTNKFTVNSIQEVHNHALVTQECAHMLPSQRKISTSQAIELELAEQSGISIKNCYELMGRQAGGRESLGYIKQDIKNYLQSKRQRQLAFGEAGSLLNYFQKQTLENPSFFYAVQLDNEEQITNIFWADAKMILDYGQFGDLVSFDTTYRTNRDNRPLAVFVGFNHHRETIIFGAALMYDETADSFIWLFETFLEAMSKKSPKTIFTDQDASMAKAISFVMPETYHRLCTWHIMQNALKKVSHIFRGRSGVHKVLSKFMESYDEEDEFLAAWDAMLIEYNVHENDWFKRIFEVRKKWAYAYVRGIWCAGLQTTQVSESINSDLKDYLKSDHDLMQFFKHFERVLNDKRYKELEAEYALCQKLPQVQRPIKMLIEAGNVYTKIVFEEFQNEFMSALDFFTKSTIDDGEYIVYMVVDLDTSKEFRVKRKKSDNYISCCCRLFEMNGVLCGHAIKILREAMNLKEIPSEYILKRWTRKARSESVKDMHGRDIQVDVKLQQSTWYRSLCSIFTKISSRGAESEKTYKIAVERANELSNTIEEMLSSQRDGTSHEQDDQGSVPIVDNTCVQAKGFKKRGGSRGRKRMTSQLERAYMRKLSLMRQLLSNKGSGTSVVQANGSKSTSDVPANDLKSTSDVQVNGSKRRRQTSRGRKSTKTNSNASPSLSSKEMVSIPTDIVAREADHPIQQASPQTPLVGLSNSSSIVRYTSNDLQLSTLVVDPSSTIPPMMNCINQFSQTVHPPYVSQNYPSTWMQYGACEPTSFLELLQNNNTGHLGFEDVQAVNNNVCGQALDLNVYAEEFDNFID